MPRMIPKGIKVPDGAISNAASNAPLAPPGHEQREQLKERSDQLAQQAEATSPDHIAINPNSLEIDPEILKQLRGDYMLTVSNMDPAFHYVWAHAGRNGYYIKAKLALGYKVVAGESQEAIEHRAPDGTRTIGDAILLKINKAKFDQIVRHQEYLQNLRAGHAEEGLKELGDRYGVKVYTDTDMPEKLRDTMGKRALAADVAKRVTDRRIRQGRMPGLPVG